MTTVAEVIYKLEYQRRDFNDRMIDYGGVNEAYDMAIRSLEAWENVKEEIRHTSRAYDMRKEDGYFGIVYMLSEKDAMLIIDKHLKGVTQNEQKHDGNNERN